MYFAFCFSLLALLVINALSLTVSTVPHSYAALGTARSAIPFASSFGAAAVDGAMFQHDAVAEEEKITSEVRAAHQHNKRARSSDAAEAAALYKASLEGQLEGFQHGYNLIKHNQESTCKPFGRVAKAKAHEYGVSAAKRGLDAQIEYLKAELGKERKTPVTRIGNRFLDPASRFYETRLKQVRIDGQKEGLELAQTVFGGVYTQISEGDIRRAQSDLAENLVRPRAQEILEGYTDSARKAGAQIAQKLETAIDAVKNNKVDESFGTSLKELGGRGPL